MGDAIQKTAISSLQEVRNLIKELPGPDLESLKKFTLHDAQLTKPMGSLGKLETLVEWLTSWQAQYPPSLNHPRTSVFAGNHGVAKYGVSAFPSSVTSEMVKNFVEGGAAVNQLCKTFDADLRVYELGLEHPTSDFTKEPAMTEEDCVRAMAYGMMAIEPGLDVVCLGEMGIGNTTSAAAVSMGLFGGKAEEWVGRGTGITPKTLEKKIKLVQAAVDFHLPQTEDPLSIFAALGGLELAAIIGTIIAARLARVPVILDGFACTASAAVLFALDPTTIDHCLVAHRSVEPGHTKLLELMCKDPLFDLGLRLGEGSGATLALGILKAAVNCHTGMATFSSAGISGPESG